MIEFEKPNIECLEINEENNRRSTKQKASSFRRYTKLSNRQSDSSRKKGRLKSTKVEMKKEKLQQTMQK